MTQKLHSLPGRNILLLRELPALGKNLTEGIVKAFQDSKGHGFFGVHTIIFPETNEPIRANLSRVFLEQDKKLVPKIIMLQGYEDDTLEWRLGEVKEFKSESPILIITGESDAPNPIPGNWTEILGQLAGFGLKIVHLYGYEGQTVPLDVWEAWQALRLKNNPDTTDFRIQNAIREWLDENPNLKTRPILIYGCVLGAFVELLEHRNRFGLEVVIEHDLLIPGYDKEHIQMRRMIIERDKTEGS